jgi:cytoskeletal protein RodZ
MGETGLNDTIAPAVAASTAYTDLIGSRLGEPISSKLSQTDIEKKALSPGLQLMQARTALGCTVEAIAAQLNLATRQIRAMEADDYAALPGLATTRGFFRAYAKLLKLDALPLLALIPTETTQKEADLASKRERRTLSRATLFGIAFTVLALLVLIKYV